MLEILGIWLLTRKIGSMVEEKGFRSGWYLLMAAALFLGGELIGAFVSAVLVNGGPYTIYAFAIGGALFGAAIAYNIASRLPEGVIDLTVQLKPVELTPVPEPLPERQVIHTGQYLEAGTESEPAASINIEQLSICPNCHLMVMPKPDGTCPGCRARVEV